MDFNFPRRKGTGFAHRLRGVSAECIDLMSRLLAYAPEDRISAKQALRHPFFAELRAAEKQHKMARAQNLAGLGDGAEQVCHYSCVSEWVSVCVCEWVSVCVCVCE